jgi:hemerythrin-like domain-containing protein
MHYSINGGVAMPQSVRNLQLEHQSLGRLLDIMDEWVGEFSASQAPDYRLLQTIADYLLSYPDDVHHPKEDLIFLKLQHRDSHAASKLAQLLDEHRDLREMTHEFAACVSDSTRPAASRPEQVLQATRKLVDYYRHHIRMEEEHFFPTAERVLTKGDWAEIDFAFSERTDPLLHEAETKYKNLRAKISRISKEAQEQ